jgi:hypothetical protein
MSEPEISVQDAIAIGSRLAGRPALAAHPARPGGNNRVFRLDMADGSRLSLKYYPLQSIDGRDRLGQEYEALSFLARQGIRLTPQPIARDADNNCALYEWFDGEAAVLRPQEDDADQLADFLVELQRLCNAEDARDLRDASASIFSPAEAVAQYQQRLNRLQRSAREHPDLCEFLDRRLVPSGATVIRRLEQRYASLGWDLGAPLANAHRVLSPSDFGLHNALRGQDGQLRFVDFEYFGWDDPVKLVSDTAIHPGSDLPESGASRLIERLSAVFEANDPSFAVRRDVLYPVFGVIWCLIILNDYLPESHSRRVLAAQGGVLEARLTGQLDKARRLHQTVFERDPDLAPR